MSSSPAWAQPDAALRPANTIGPSLHGWVTSFVMAPHNTRIVRRSNALLGWAYGKNFRYSEVMSTRRSLLSPLLATAIAGGMFAMNVVGPLVSGERVLHDDDFCPYLFGSQVPRDLLGAG